MTQKLRAQFSFTCIFCFLVAHGYLPRERMIKVYVVSRVLEVQQENTRQDNTRQDKTRQDKTRQEKTIVFTRMEPIIYLGLKKITWS